MPSLEHSPLGRVTDYPDQYDASLLYPIARAENRRAIGVGATLPFLGADLWTAFELGWLNRRGKPQVALAHFSVPCESVNIVESKSFKIYLGSFNNTRFGDVDEVRSRLRADLDEALWRGASAVGTGVGVKMLESASFALEPMHELDGLSLDRLDVECTRYTPAPELLHAALDEKPVDEVLTSNLLRSNCPVTGQPDWGSVQIAYSGPQIDQHGLLQYLVSFRNHNEFHEQCVERIYMDIWRRCKPARLAVYARYTRRGGLDINPFRTSSPQALPRNVRTARQ